MHLLLLLLLSIINSCRCLLLFFYHTKTKSSLFNYIFRFALFRLHNAVVTQCLLNYIKGELSIKYDSILASHSKNLLFWSAFVVCISFSSWLNLLTGLNSWLSIIIAILSYIFNPVLRIKMFINSYTDTQLMLMIFQALHTATLYDWYKKKKKKMCCQTFVQMQ